MLIETLSAKRKCVCCKAISVNEYFVYEHCGIILNIPLCPDCQKTASFLLVRQLKPLCNSISKAVMMSHMLGEDGMELRDLRQKIQELEVEESE